MFRRRRRRRGPRRTAAVFAPPRRRPRQDLRVRAVRVRWKETEARWRAPCPVWRHARKGVLGQLLYVFAMMMVVDRLLALQRPPLVPMDGLEHLRTRKVLDLECPHAARETALRHRRRRGCAGSEIVGKVCPEGFEPPAGTHRAPPISKDKKISHTRLTPPPSRPAAAQPSRSRAIAMISAAQTRCPAPSKGSTAAPRRATRHRCTQPARCGVEEERKRWWRPRAVGGPRVLPATPSRFISP